MDGGYFTKIPKCENLVNRWMQSQNESKHSSIGQLISAKRAWFDKA
jgi:hypothetical protein